MYRPPRERVNFLDNAGLHFIGPPLIREAAPALTQRWSGGGLRYMPIKRQMGFEKNKCRTQTTCVPNVGSTRRQRRRRWRRIEPTLAGNFAFSDRSSPLIPANGNTGLVTYFSFSAVIPCQVSDWRCLFPATA